MPEKLESEIGNEQDDLISADTPRKSWRTTKAGRALDKIPVDLLPLLILGLTVFIVILYANDWKFWDGQRSLEVTNDAYVRADVTPLSTKVSGTVARVLINDFDQVKKGQLLVQLRDDDFIARANQAKASYDQALANITTIERQTDVQKERVTNADFGVSIGAQDITRAGADVSANQSTLTAARSSLSEALAAKMAAQEKLKADQAILLRAEQERHRQEELFVDKASTKQTVEQVIADHDHALAAVAADQAEVSRLDNVAAQRSAEIARQGHDVIAAGAQNKGSQYALSGKQSQLAGEKKQLDVLAAQLKEAQAEAQSRLASWHVALAELDYTKIIAPENGSLSERRVRAGQQVSAGTQVVTLVSSVPWVIASFRETQMRNVAVGDSAEVTVDALGGALLKGHIQSMSPASEAQFALLPPDNPSGNFTKITQRLPVKIVFDKDQKLLSRIKPGMTVIAKITTRL